MSINIIKYFLAIFIVVLAQNSFSYVIDSRISEDGSGAIHQDVSILCSLSDLDFCHRICEDEIFCIIPEPLCLSCAGGSSTLLRIIFSRLPVYFQTDFQQIDNFDISEFLMTKNYVLLSYNSIYNFYRNTDSEELRQQFSEFCPAGSELPLLAVVLNSENKPSDLVYAFCRKSSELSDQEETIVYSIEPKINILKEMITIQNLD